MLIITKPDENKSVMRNNNNIRIIYPDTLVVLATGDVKTFKDFVKNYPTKSVICYVNHDEHSLKSIRNLIDSDIYKRHFISQSHHTLENIYISTAHDFCEKKKEDYNTFVLRARAVFEDKVKSDFVGEAKDLVIEYMLARNEEEKYGFLEKLYQVHKRTLTANKITEAIDATAIPPNLTLSANALRLKFLNIAHYYHHMLPKIYQDLAPSAGFQIMAASKAEDFAELTKEGMALTTQGVFCLIPNDKKSLKNQATLLEELTHLFDAKLGFSKREAWRNACESDKKEARKHLDKFFWRAGKSTAYILLGRNGSFGYAKENIPTELLADLFVVNHTDIYSSEEKRVLKSAIPHMWQQYEIFNGDLEKLRDSKINQSKNYGLKQIQDPVMPPNSIIEFGELTKANIPTKKSKHK